MLSLDGGKVLSLDGGKVLSLGTEVRCCHWGRR